MRPLTITMEGFGAFREQTAVDFADAELFALVGPTGSGKSTVIDAICFALYGSVPRYGDGRRVEPVISSGAQRARVSFVFELDGDRYVVARDVRRGKHGASTKEIRVERVRDDGSTESLAAGVREAGPVVEDLLGMPFEHFTRSVVLPQGEFARFLHDKPSDRQDLLVELLGWKLYERMGQMARERAAAAERDLGLHAERLTALAGSTPEALAEAEARVASLADVGQVVADARTDLDRLAKEADAAAADAAAARGLAEALEAIEVPKAVVKVGPQLAEAAEARADADDAHRNAQEALDAAAEAADAMLSPSSLEAVLAAHARLGALEGERTAADRAAADAASAEADTHDAVGAAADDLDAVAAQHAAHAVAEHLVAGEPCPVCDQVVEKVPKRAKPKALAAARKALKKAEDTLAKARNARAVADADVASLAKEAERLATEVEAHPDAAAVEAAHAAAEAAYEAVDRARTAERTTRKEAEDSAAAVAKLEKSLKKASTTFDTKRDTVVVLDPPTRGADLVAAWTDLAEWAAARQPEQDTAAESAAERADATRKERAGLAAGLEAQAAALGVEASVDDLGAQVGAARATAGHVAEALAAEIAEADQIRTDTADLERARGVAASLGNHLRSDRFEKWLVEEALEVLMHDASGTLRDLSGGRYSLAVEDAVIYVVDHANADERRLAKTLSGGETFQASLALALALADQIADLAADGAARLEAIFLDEGFGTLDEESLDTVASTIEALGAHDRMVGLVTHVRALAERVPTRYVVTKGTRTATVERVDT